MVAQIGEPRTEEEAQEVQRFLETGAETVLEEIQAFELPEGVTVPLRETAEVEFDVSGQEVIDLLAQVDEGQVSMEVEVAEIVAEPGVYVLAFVNSDDVRAQVPPGDVTAIGGFGFFLMADMLPTEEHPLVYRLDATAALQRTATEEPVRLGLLLLAGTGEPAVLELAVSRIRLVVTESIVRA